MLAQDPTAPVSVRGSISTASRTQSGAQRHVVGGTAAAAPSRPSAASAMANTAITAAYRPAAHRPAVHAISRPSGSSAANPAVFTGRSRSSYACRSRCSRHFAKDGGRRAIRKSRACRTRAPCRQKWRRISSFSNRTSPSTARYAQTRCAVRRMSRDNLRRDAPHDSAASARFRPVTTTAVDGRSSATRPSRCPATARTSDQRRPHRKRHHRPPGSRIRMTPVQRPSARHSPCH